MPYDEIYLPRQTAPMLAERAKNKSAGHWFERFIIDGQAAKQTPLGFSGTIGSNYSSAFAAAGLFCIVATFGQQVANSAMKALIFSLLVISGYVALRFEPKFAIPVLLATASGYCDCGSWRGIISGFSQGLPLIVGRDVYADPALGPDAFLARYALRSA